MKQLSLNIIMSAVITFKWIIVKTALMRTVLWGQRWCLCVWLFPVCVTPLVLMCSVTGPVEDEWVYTHITAKIQPCGCTAVFSVKWYFDKNCYLWCVFEDKCCSSSLGRKCRFSDLCKPNYCKYYCAQMLLLKYNWRFFCTLHCCWLCTEFVLSAGWYRPSIDILICLLIWKHLFKEHIMQKTTLQRHNNTTAALHLHSSTFQREILSHLLHWMFSFSAIATG